jgi:glycine/D-amino acid oxidase-like deaminating enzyme
VANNSPWIHQLDHERKTTPLSSDESTDVAIIGAGIAGISTAFFLLKHTDKKIMIIEGDKLAHGATGHNAGQIASYFERPFRDICKEFGLEMACQGQKSLESAWELLDEMYTEAGLDIPLDRVPGHMGLSTKEQVLDHLENDFLRRKGGLRSHTLEIFEDAPFIHEIPEQYHKQIHFVSREEIALKLETFDPQYIAVLSSQKGVMNSALFCQEVVSFLTEAYRDRFRLYEHTHVKKVVLKEDKVLLDAVKHTVECEQVVLCTNGFDNFDIISAAGLALDTRFHHAIHGVVGFMSGYLEKFTGVPAALSYFQKKIKGLTETPGEPYFYVTRRQYEYEKKAKHNLISVGGPDFALEERGKYDRSLEFSESAKKQITDFIRHTYDKAEDMDYTFMWHGMMGYTTNLLRMVGHDPEHSRLFYNLGCNGVGILPSIFGGDKVARQIKGESFPPSIFDVRVRGEKSPLSAPDLWSEASVS